MPIPKYQQLMEPTLIVLSESGLISKAALVQKVADQIRLSAEQKQFTVDGGNRTLLDYRVSWALSYMKRAAVLNNPERGFWIILERGRTLLNNKERPIDIKTLSQFEEFRQWRGGTRTRTTAESVEAVNDSSTLSPDEQLSAAAKDIRVDVQLELLDQLYATDPTRFEHIVLDVLRAIGYGGDFAGAIQAVGQPGDKGIDGVIDQDILGLDSIYVQAKRWRDTVGRPAVQSFAGALQGQNATKGVMITTSKFSSEAIEYAENIPGSRIILISGVRLTGLMYDNEVGVSRAAVIITRTVDTDYFKRFLPNC